MRVRLLTLGLLSTVLVTLTPAPSLAVDLNGHWKGTVSCKGFDVEKYSGTRKDVNMAITQTGNKLAVNLKGTIYNGSVLTDDAKPTNGEVILIGCDTDTVLEQNADFTAIVRAAVKTKSGVTKASFSGLGIFEIWLTLHFEAVETCKLTFTRIDTNPANVTGCPAP